VPTGYTVGTPIATLIGLHGLGHEPHAFVDAAMYQQLADALQVAVVGVSGTVALGKRSFVWSGNVRRDGEHVRRVLADLAGKLTVAGGKRTLFGFSQGAQVAFEIAIQEPQEYLGAVVMSPGSSRNAQLQQSARGTHSHQAFVCTSGAAERPEVVQQTNADCQIARESGARVELKLYPGVSQHRLPSDFESAFPAWVGFIGNARAR
jgi:predicted esterase